MLEFVSLYEMITERFKSYSKRIVPNGKPCAFNDAAYVYSCDAMPKIKTNGIYDFLQKGNAK